MLLAGPQPDNLDLDPDDQGDQGTVPDLLGQNQNRSFPGALGIGCADRTLARISREQQDSEFYRGLVK